VSTTLNLELPEATGMKVGLLANFGSYPNAEVERRILSGSS
jgi:hypothetical protein